MSPPSFVQKEKPSGMADDETPLTLAMTQYIRTQSLEKKRQVSSLAIKQVNHTMPVPRKGPM